MSVQSFDKGSRIEQLRGHLEVNGYAAVIQQRYLAVAQRFLDYLEGKAVAIEAVRKPVLEDFLRWERRSFSKRNGRAPRNLLHWRQYHTSAVHMLLRLVHGQWPVAAVPAEAFHHELADRYDMWMRDVRGLAPVTRIKRATQALQFLAALGPRGDQEALYRLTVRDVDAYVRQRCVDLRRATIEDYTSNLRDFLRHLHGSDRTAFDLSRSVIGPRIYEFEHVPSALRAEEVEKVLEVARQDHSASGRRDHAILMLLATYGLRAGEIVMLQLNDVDWRKEILRVRHSKTGTHSELPLLRPVGEALLSYLEKARPASAYRELFLHVQAPYRPFTGGSSLTAVVSARLRSARITPEGRKGCHAFRHAKAVGLLRGGVPLKVIGDVLGHRSASSTAVYLKLATEELRAVGLDIPKGVAP